MNKKKEKTPARPDSQCPNCGFKDTIKAGPFNRSHTFQDEGDTEFHCHHTIYTQYHCTECMQVWEGTEKPSNVECWCGYPFVEKD